ncbi:flagellin [Kineococcus radiotolerans]|uniref:Flagellin n=1 Tax=Kineococcus radiotolerans TaxID=131568 RepID=A0A7W4TIQ7_KINRA|nr:flagellin [Kineococcus radiotolerans]MBB2899679.1 flagellin [Kineococcus radiotolerans]
MGLRINNNIAAVNSYRNLAATDKAQNSSLEKLSSGFRINKAADDAAGLVVSEGLRSQVNGLNTAARNAQDGVNLAQTADGALGTVTTILQRMRDLAVQASNTGAADSSARGAAQTELEQLNKEIDRIASTTTFGSTKLLDGTFGERYKGLASASADLGTVVVTGTTSIDGQFKIPSGSEFTYKYTAPGQTAQVDKTVKLSSAEGKTYSTTAAGEKELQADLNRDLQAAGVTATVSRTSGAGAKFTVTYQIEGTEKNAKYEIAAQTGIAGALSDAAGSKVGGTLDKAFQVGAYGTDNDQIKIAIGKMDTSTDGLNTTSINLGTDAKGAISTLDQALNKVSAARSNIGAVQNRFEHAINNLNVSIENITASESAIRDTDMAKEMTKFTKNQILSQAGTSMLAQANSGSQNILSLLRG